MNNTPDGDYQTYRAEDGAFIREHFFGRDPRTKALVANMSDDDIWALKRGGHDYRKLYAAYSAAVNHTGRPTVIIANTIKGYGLGPSFAARNATHQMKELKNADLKLLRDSLRLPITDDQIDAEEHLPPYFHPGMDAPEIEYLMERRRALGGFIPERRSKYVQVETPAEKSYDRLKKGSGRQHIATTQALVQLFKDLLRDKNFGKRIVPIIPDEARTFGLDSIFPSTKIFNTLGQNYLAVDRDLLLSYKESEAGGLLHTGINEAGSAAAFQAVGTSYATHGEPLIPFYIYYSMFGFQRTGDQFWAAGDQLTRGFLIGATAGRTTLTGEGLQHADGHSPVLSSTNTAMVHYDPAYGYEIRHIVKDGLQRMFDEDDRNPDVNYSLPAYTEPMLQPAEREDVEVEGILKGIYQLAAPAEGEGPEVQLLASGVAVPWALKARDVLAEDWGVRAGVWSVTSWSELRRDALAADREAFVNPDGEQRQAYVTQKLSGAQGPFVGTSDYDFQVPDHIRAWVPGDYWTLGADGFGFSDTRPAVRRHFLIDTESIVTRALQALAKRGDVDASAPAQAVQKYQLLDVTAGTTGSAGGDS